ncbi:integrase domain-containing protein [Porticoccaceae bacterium]|nr:integrase domain-containing protein [Porticoccaceae bacterium]
MTDDDVTKARLVKPHTNTQIKNAKPKAKEYNLADGNGLALRIKTNGSRLWIFNYSKPYTKKRSNISFGKFPDLSLVDARKLGAESRNLLAKDIDPQAHGQQEKIKARFEEQSTFRLVALEWLKVKRSKVSDPHADDIWRSLEKYTFPTIGDTPISKVTAPITIAALKPLEEKRTLETVKRQCQRINEVMIYALNVGLIEHNPLAGIKEAFMAPQKRNFPTISPAELSDLMKDLKKASINLETHCLIQWQLHSMVRPSEAAGAKWKEIDVDAKIWVIPAERMKKRRLHKVPLTPQMLNILDVMTRHTGKRDHIFCGFRDPRSSMNSQTVNQALKRMGYKERLVAHGLRSLASTILNEARFPADIIEASLAHVDQNGTRGDYNRAEYLELRREMMCWWSNHIEQAAKGNLNIAKAQ